MYRPEDDRVARPKHVCNLTVQISIKVPCLARKGLCFFFFLKISVAATRGEKSRAPGRPGE